MDKFLIKEQEVRKGFWAKVKNSLRRAHFLREAIAAYYCAFDKETPLHVKGTLLGALAYFILPFDALPDVMALFGFTDDATVLFAAIRTVGHHINEDHRMKARQRLDELLKSD